jgi:hypothetical protein
MTKQTMLAGALLTLTLLVSLPAIVSAGGGGIGGGPLTGVFLSDCYKIVGGFNAPYTLDITDQFGNHQAVKIGQAQMVCVASGDWMRSPTVNQPVLNESFDPTTVNSAKCYDVVAPADASPGTTGTVVDIFGNQTAALKKMSMVCVPSTLE